jgi:hypothetical protein
LKNKFPHIISNIALKKSINLLDLCHPLKMISGKNETKNFKIGRRDKGLEEMFWSLCVCVGGIISDYCNFQIRKELFFTFKMSVFSISLINHELFISLYCPLPNIWSLKNTGVRKRRVIWKRVIRFRFQIAQTEHNYLIYINIKNYF